MKTSSVSTIALVTGLLCVLQVASVASMSYTCHPNGTIVVDDPVPTELNYSMAVDYVLMDAGSSASSFTCALKWSSDKSQIIIGPSPGGYCTRGRGIQLSLSSAEISSDYIFSDPENIVAYYRVRCTEIPLEGVTINVIQEFHPDMELFDMAPPTVEEEEITPMMNGSVKSAMRRCCDFHTNEPITSAEVGAHLHWTLDIYHEYYVYPIDCTAHSGQSITGAPSIPLYLEGCARDPNLSGYNTTSTFSGRRMYVMDFFVFHFYNSEYVTIDCKLKICPTVSSFLCTWPVECDRRKRGIGAPDHADGYRRRRSDQGADEADEAAPMYTHSRTTLRVIPGQGKSRADMACHPNGTIVVNNPEPTDLNYIMAVDYAQMEAGSFPASSFTCALKWTSDKSRIIIGPSPGGYCTRGRGIQLSLSSAAISSDYIFSDPDIIVSYYRVRCTEIRQEGVTINVIQEFHPETEIFDMAPPTVEEEEITPMMNGSVKSAMRRCCDFHTNEPISSAEVGAHLHWTLDIYHDYYVYPIDCTAHSGQSITGSPSKPLYLEGCAIDLNLSGYNTTVAFSGRRMYVMDFFVFHFYNSEYVTIDCKLKICPTVSSFLCTWPVDCDRRKRGIGAPDHADGYRRRRSDQGADEADEADEAAPMYTHSRTTLRVLPGQGKSRANMDYWPLWQLLAAAVLLSLLVTTVLFVISNNGQPLRSHQLSQNPLLPGTHA